MTDAWRLFDRLAPTYDDVIPFFATLGAAFVERLDPPAGARLLDIGAGRGAIAGPAAARGCAVTAVDASPRMIDRLAAAHPGIDARVMDVHHLDLPDASYDIATAGFVIHVVEDPAQVLAGLRRVVRGGGTVAFTTPSDCDDGGRWDDFQALVGEYRGKIVGRGRPGRDIELEELLARAGFVDIREAALEVHIPVDDPETCWRFHMSHGFAGFVWSLSPSDAAELHDRAIEEFARMRANGGIVLDRAATVTLATTTA